MRILVTGGTGFAGSHLIEELLARGFGDVYSTTFSLPDPTVQLLPQDHYVQVNLTDKQATAMLFKKIKPDWIFHLASFAYVGKSFDKAEELFANNIKLQLNVLEALRLYAPQARMLTIGSAEEYGIVPSNTVAINESFPLNPVNPYAVSKVTQDLLANSYFLSYGLDIVRTRSFNHIGTRQTGDFAVPSFVKQIVAIERGEQKELLVGKLSAIRDFTPVQDMVRAYILLMEKGEKGEVYNIGTGIGVKMEEIVDILASLSTVKIKRQEDSSRVRPLDAPALIADNSKIGALGWKPTIELKSVLEDILVDERKKSV